MSSLSRFDFVDQTSSGQRSVSRYAFHLCQLLEIQKYTMPRLSTKLRADKRYAAPPRQRPSSIPLAFPLCGRVSVPVLAIRAIESCHRPPVFKEKVGTYYVPYGSGQGQGVV